MSIGYNFSSLTDYEETQEEPEIHKSRRSVITRKARGGTGARKKQETTSIYGSGAVEEASGEADTNRHDDDPA